MASNTQDTLKTIKLTHSLYNTQISGLINNLQENMNNLVYKTQIDLISKISQDYNISVRELTRKYVQKPKKIKKRDQSLDIDTESPTLQTINSAKNNPADSDSDSELYVPPINLDDEESILNSTSFSMGKKSKKLINQTSSTDLANIETGSVGFSGTLGFVGSGGPNGTTESNIVFKTFDYKGKKYLVNPTTNEIMDMNEKVVGIKENGKYKIKV